MQPDGIPYTVLGNNLTDHDTFIQGLRNAGFQIHDEHISVVPSCPEVAMITFASGVHARHAMLTLHLREIQGMDGKKMWLMKSPQQRVGRDYRSPCAPLPTHSVILQAMGEAYYERAKAPRRAERVAEKLAKELRRKEHEMRLEEARLEKQAKQAKQAKKAANIKKAEEARQKAKLAKEKRRAQHLKRMEEAKLKKEAKMKEANLKKEVKTTTQQNEDPSDRIAGMQDIRAEWNKELSDGFEGMEHIQAVAEEKPEVSAWLEAMRQQHMDREDLGTALQG